MNKRSHIDLTPLLDVILLLVFGFMFVLASTNTQLANTEADYKASQNESTTSITALEAENKALTQTVDNLNAALAKQDATYKKVTQGIAAYFSLNQAELDALLAQQSAESAHMYLSTQTDANDVAKSMVMYELLQNEFYFVEVVLSGEDNRVVINGAQTSVNVLFTDVTDAASKADKKQAVKDAISKEIDARPGGSSMVFVTLATDNPEVYHFAWSLTWQAISELTEKYGAKNYYSAELFIKENLNDE